MIQIIIKLLKTITIIFLFTTKIIANERVIIGTTTSTYDSGLMSYLTESFEKQHNYKIHVVAKSTGQIINSAKKGNIDILIVHHKPSEEKFVNNGFGFKRYKLMYNNFIIVGPKSDPAKIYGLKSLKVAMNNIYNSQEIFVSRSDKSGTHYKELDLWRYAGIDIKIMKNNYKKIGAGMGTALNYTNNILGYTLTDRSTWESFDNKRNLKVLYEGHKILFNQYSVILVKKAKNLNSAETFMKWILSGDGKKHINTFKIHEKQLFFFNGDNYIDINNG